jgi:hypothetical protein
MKNLPKNKPANRFRCYDSAVSNLLLTVTPIDPRSEALTLDPSLTATDPDDGDEVSDLPEVIAYPIPAVRITSCT